MNYKTEIDRYKRYYQTIEPELSKPANKAYTAIIFSFLAVSLFGWYAIRPTMQTIFSLKREITDKTDVNKKMEDKISALIEAQATYQQIETNIPIINQAIPTNSDAVHLVAQLRALASETGVTLVGTTLPSLPLAREETAVNNPTPLKLTDFSISISLAGGYIEVKNFLESLLSLRRIVQIESMAFTPQRRVAPRDIESTESAELISVTTSTPVQVDLKLKAYYFK